MKTEDEILANAIRIETKQGHLIQKSGDVWYAYPKIDNLPGNGGDVIMNSFGQPVQYNTPVEAYLACVKRAGK